MKKQTNLKLDVKTKEEIKFLATTLDLSEAGVVEIAVKKLMSEHKLNPYKVTNEFYKFVTNMATDLENIRDYAPEQWSQECETLHDSLMKTWQMIRNLPTFWEPHYLDDNFEVLDEEHFKNKPF